MDIKKEIPKDRGGYPGDSILDEDTVLGERYIRDEPSAVGFGEPASIWELTVKRPDGRIYYASVYRATKIQN